ncbi:MAG: Crp/Fnr family transcriptional regulator [Clostridium sp.]
MKKLEDKLNKLYEVYPVLKEINDNRNRVIESNIVFRDLLDGEYLKTSEESCAGFLFVLSGTIKIQRVTNNGEETNLYNIEKGQLCHEALSCFLNYRPLNIEGKAIQDSKIAILSSDILIKYLLQDTKFMQVIYKDLYAKFNRIIDNKEQIVHDTLETRIVKYLIGKKCNIVYATHSEIAFEIDSAREAVSRKLKKFENDGYIEISRGKIQVVKDLSELI